MMVTINSGEQVRKWWGDSTPAITWHGVEVISGTVKPGDVLTLVYTATINKQCPSDLRGFLVAPDGTVPVRLPITNGGYSRPSDGPINIRVSILIPKTSDPGLAPLVSGIYTYRAVATRYCPDGVEEDSTIPDALVDLQVD